MHVNLSSQDRVIKYLDCFKVQISYTLTEKGALALHYILNNVCLLEKKILWETTEYCCSIKENRPKTKQQVLSSFIWNPES